jgi:hypothetical protein
MAARADFQSFTRRAAFEAERRPPLVNAGEFPISSGVEVGHAGQERHDRPDLVGSVRCDPGRHPSVFLAVAHDPVELPRRPLVH